LIIKQKNVEMDDAIFKMPAKTEKEETPKQ